MSVLPDPHSWEFKRQKYDDRRVASEYDARRYRTWARRWREALHAGLLARAFAEVPPGSVVLDVPCGTAHLAPWLLSRGYRVIGADIARAMLEVAAGKHPPPRPPELLGFSVADIERLPFADRSIDAALVVRFIHLMPEDVRHRVYRELARVARERVIFSVSLDPWAMKHVLRRLRGKAKPYFMSEAALREELAANGLVVERVHRKLPVISTAWVVVCRPSPT